MTDLRVSFPRPCDEPWEAMTPTAGCDRVCARCDRVIHDLANYEIDEAEALLRDNSGSCVRARIDADGVVATKTGRSMRRMVLAAGAMGLLAGAAPALAGQDAPKGAISGRLIGSYASTQIVAIGADGTRHAALIDKDGRYRVGDLADGTYELVATSCGDKWTIGKFVVANAEVIVPDRDEGPCEIIIGKIMVDDGKQSG